MPSSKWYSPINTTFYMEAYDGQNFNLYLNAIFSHHLKLHIAAA